MEMNTIDTARQTFFNERADAWLDKHYKDEDTGEFNRYREQINTIVDTLNLQPDYRVLDLGCGAGVLVPYILERLSTRGRLVEMDYAQEMIRANQARHSDSRIRFRCAHVMDMGGVPASFDAVICFACFPHFQDPEGALEEISRLLKPGGTLTVAHLMSSKQLEAHHKTESAVSGDRLPSQEWMYTHFTEKGLNIIAFTDQPGLFSLTAVKAGGHMKHTGRN